MDSVHILTDLDMTGTWSSGDTVITVVSTARLLVGYTVYNNGIEDYTTIAAITSSTTFILSAPTTAAGNKASLRFSDIQTVLANWKTFPIMVNQNWPLSGLEPPGGLWPLIGGVPGIGNATPYSYIGSGETFSSGGFSTFRFFSKWLKWTSFLETKKLSASQPMYGYINPDDGVTYLQLEVNYYRFITDPRSGHEVQIPGVGTLTATYSNPNTAANVLSIHNELMAALNFDGMDWGDSRGASYVWISGANSLVITNSVGGPQPGVTTCYAEFTVTDEGTVTKSKCQYRHTANVAAFPDGLVDLTCWKGRHVLRTNDYGDPINFYVSSVDFEHTPDAASSDLAPDITLRSLADEVSCDDLTENTWMQVEGKVYSPTLSLNAIGHSGDPFDEDTSLSTNPWGLFRVYKSGFANYTQSRNIPKIFRTETASGSFPGNNTPTEPPRSYSGRQRYTGSNATQMSDDDRFTRFTRNFFMDVPLPATRGPLPDQTTRTATNSRKPGTGFKLKSRQETEQVFKRPALSQHDDILLGTITFKLTEELTTEELRTVGDYWAKFYMATPAWPIPSSNAYIEAVGRGPAMICAKYLTPDETCYMRLQSTITPSVSIPTALSVDISTVANWTEVIVTATGSSTVNKTRSFTIPSGGTNANSYSEQYLGDEGERRFICNLTCEPDDNLSYGIYLERI